jgi:hypothetical protein
MKQSDEKCYDTSGNSSNTNGYDSKEKLQAKNEKHNKTHIDYECGILKIEKVKTEKAVHTSTTGKLDCKTNEKQKTL